MTIDVASALKTLGLLRKNGFSVTWIDAEALVRFEAPTTPPDDVVVALDAHEQAIAALYRPDGSGISGMEWRAVHENLTREHVRSFPGQMASGHYHGLRLRIARLTAVTRGRKRLRQFVWAEAHEHVLIEWLNRRYPAGGSRDPCAHCGGNELHDGDPLLPFGVGPHARVHGRCWEAWRAARRAQAIEALAEYGIAGASADKRRADK